MLTVTTWNVQNLFPAGSADGPKTQADYDAKLDALAATITTLKPDVVAFQEVGDPASLDDLLGRVGGAWNAEVSAHPDPRGIRVALASRHPVSTVDETDTFAAELVPVQVDDDGGTTSSLSRGVVHIMVATPNLGEVDVVTGHLKSKLLSFPNGRFNPRDEDERARFAAYALYRRTAEASSLRSFMTSLLGGHGETRPAILLGDMNDEPQAATTQILLGPPGSEIGTDGENRPDKGDAQRLLNLAPLLPADQAYSRIYRGRKELIDHIFISHALLGAVSSVRSGTGVAAGPQLRSIADNPKAAAQPATGSDHAPITATFTT